MERLIKDCSTCKYSECVMFPWDEIGTPSCTLDIPEWLDCRNNFYKRWESDSNEK